MITTNLTDKLIELVKLQERKILFLEKMKENGWSSSVTEEEHKKEQERKEEEAKEVKSTQKNVGLLS